MIVTITALLLNAAPGCAWQESEKEPTRMWVERDVVHYQRGYMGTWALCAQQSEEPKPLARVWVDRGKGWEKIAEETPEIHGSPSPGMSRRVRVVRGVCDSLPGPPSGQRILRGSVGEERWYYPVKVKVEIDARGAWAGLAHQETITTYCAACTENRGVQAGIVQDYRKNTFRMYAAINEDFKKCVGESRTHRLHLRVFAGASGDEADHALIPQVEWRDLQLEVRKSPDKKWSKGLLVYEEEFPLERLCRFGKTILVETAGLGEYFNNEYRRWSIDPMRCP